MSTHPGVSEIIKRYKSYSAEIHEVFEDFLFANHYYPILHEKIKNDEISLMRFESALSTYKAPFKKKFIYGVIDRTTKKTAPIRSFLSAVSLTENYFQNITYRIYRDCPYKLQTSIESEEQQSKLVKVIIDSIDRDEIISRIAEEKIRSIFYGNPVDFFKKDKARIGIDRELNTYYKKALEKYAEIIARRNIFIHNEGAVDSKYLREVKGSTFSKGDKPTIDKNYLKESIQILHGLATIVTDQAVSDNYPRFDKSVNDKLTRYFNRFEKNWKNK